VNNEKKKKYIYIYIYCEVPWLYILHESDGAGVLWQREIIAKEKQNQ